MPTNHLAARRKSTISPARIRAEQAEVLDHVHATSMLFVLTRVGLHLFHVDCIRTGGTAL